MNQVAERKRLRREYVKQKRRAQAKAALGITFATAMALAIVASLCALGLFFLAAPFMEDDVTEAAVAPPYGPFILGWLLVTMILFLLAWYSSKTYTNAITEVKRLTYVPPVTLDTLPAEEILVRAAVVPPVAQSTVLLRAAQREQETPKEELLRMSQGE